MNRTILPAEETAILTTTVSSSSTTDDEPFGTVELNVFDWESIDSWELLVAFIAFGRTMRALY